MDPSSTGNQEEHRFPLMRLPAETRNVIYRHALDHAFPKLVLPKWMRGMQRWHEYTTGNAVATERLAASSFTNLQLSNRQVYREVSYILYQTCHFAFSIAPLHASFLDECLLSGPSTQYIQDKNYIHRITNIALKANWDQYDWSMTQGFLWTHWDDITFKVCRELLGFTALKKLTLDWRVPYPCDVLQPTRNQWLSISPHFERLQARRPDIRMEVLAWQKLPGSVPFKHREIRRDFTGYTQDFQRDTGTPGDTPAFLPNQSVLSCPRSSSHQSSSISTRFLRRPVSHPCQCEISELLIATHLK